MSRCEIMADNYKVLWISLVPRKFMAINQYIAAIGMPLLLIFCGAIARKIVRGKNWERSDFYLGVELVLLSLGSALLYLYDLITIQSLTVEQSLVLAVRMRNVSVFLLTSFFLLLWVLSMHQDWQGRTGNSRKQFFWLVIFCNAIGIGLLASFVLLVKGA